MVTYFFDFLRFLIGKVDKITIKIRNLNNFGKNERVPGATLFDSARPELFSDDKIGKKCVLEVKKTFGPSIQIFS